MKTTKLCCLFIFAISFFYSQNKIIIETENTSSGKGLNVEEYMKQVNDPNKLVLVHFEADWCALCKKLEPLLNEIAIERKDKMKLFHINTDENPIITKHFEVDGLPIMILYKKGIIVWSIQGVMSKKEILGIIDEHQ